MFCSTQVSPTLFQDLFSFHLLYDKYEVQIRGHGLVTLKNFLEILLTTRYIGSLCLT